MRINLKKTISLILAIILSLSLCSCSSGSITDSKETILSIGNKDISLGTALVLILGYRDNINNTLDSSVWDAPMGDSSFGSFYQDEVKCQIALVFAGCGLAEKKGTKLSSDDEKLVQSAANYYSTNLSSEDKSLLNIDDEIIYNIFYSYRMAIKCYKDIVSNVNSEVSKDESRVINLMQIIISKVDLSEAEVSAKKSKIDEAYTKAAAGEDFSSLVSKYNEASESNLVVTRSDLSELEEKAAFDLNEGEISNVIETDDAFVIYKCTNPYNESLSISNRQSMIKDKKDKEYLISLNDYLSSNPLDWNDELWDKININELNYKISLSFFDVYKMFFPE